jgi:hypothetical protein
MACAVSWSAVKDVNVGQPLLSTHVLRMEKNSGVSAKMLTWLVTVALPPN